MLINSRRNINRQAKHLPKQLSLPNRQQLRSLSLAAEQDLNCLVELPFGNAPEAYSLTVLRERMNAACQWTLYRGEGNNSALEWTHTTNDWEQIYSLICAQFPGWDLKNKVLLENENVQVKPNIESVKEYGSFMPVKSTLEGDLRNLQIPNVLQSIAMGKLTGRLQVKSRTDTAMVFFADGVPVHCSLKGDEGDSALIQLIGWEEGQFCFFPEPKIETKTIKKRLEFLIMEGCTLLDQYTSLTGKGLNFDAVVVRKHESLTEKEFEEIVSSGTGADLDAQKHFYVAIDNQSTIFELLRNQQLTKIEWVPVLFNLVHCGLIEFHSQAQYQQDTLDTNKVGIVDWSQMLLAEKALRRPDTELFTYPAFLYFLDKEYCRFHRFARPFSIVIIKIGLGDPTVSSPMQPATLKQLDPLPLRAVRTMGQTINRIKRQIDILCHYETLDYAMLLPETNSEGAENFVQRLAELLKYAGFQDIGNAYVDFAIGAASMPEDGENLDAMLGVAHDRLQAYEQRSSGVHSTLDLSKDGINNPPK